MRKIEDVVLLCESCEFYYETSEVCMSTECINGPKMCQHEECFIFEKYIDKMGIERGYYKRIESQVQLNYGNKCKYYVEYKSIFKQIKELLCQIF